MSLAWEILLVQLSAYYEEKKMCWDEAEVAASKWTWNQFTTTAPVCHDWLFCNRVHKHS